MQQPATPLLLVRKLYRFLVSEAESPSDELLESEDIKEFYLGKKEEGVRGRRRWKKRKTWR